MRKNCDRCLPKKKALFEVQAGHSFCAKHLKEYCHNLSRKGMLEKRTIDIIKKGGRIVLKRANGCYLGQWTNIAAGWDKADWTYQSKTALEIFNLLWAFTIAPLYNCKVFVIYPKKDK